MRAPLNLRQIEMFRAVMISGSISGAARLLNVTQPGVSRTIGMLEDRLGYALFSRRGRRIIPTPEAEALYREVERSYRSIEHIAQIALDIGVQQAGAVRVATLPALAQWLVPRAISRFLSTRPNVTVYVQSLPSVQIAELVSTGRFDLGIVEMPVSRPALDIEEFGTSPAVAVMPADHRLAALGEVSIRDLAGERMILLSQPSYARYQIEDAFSAAGVAPISVVETPSSSIACALVTAGAGVTVVARSAAISFESPLIAIRPLQPTLPFRFSIVYPQLAARSKLAVAFAADLDVELRAAESRPLPSP